MSGRRWQPSQHQYFGRKAMAESKQASEGTMMQKWVRIGGVVTLYWFISISMVFLNKYLLSSKDYKLDAPLFITASQCVVASIVFIILGTVSRLRPDSIKFPPIEMDLSIALKVLPVSAVFVGMITFNNLTLKFLGVAFYNVGRSLTTVFNVSLSYLVLGQTISLKVISCCAVIVFGFLLGLFEEQGSVDNLSIWGVVCGVLASLCVALYAISTKRVLPMVDSNIWRLQYYNNLNAVPILLVLLILMREVPVLEEFKYWNRPGFWFLIILAGIFGIAIGYVTSLQIHVTSPLTHNVSGTAKACAQTILACVWFKEVKPVFWWASNAMVLGGSSAYTYVRMIEMKAEKERQQREETVENTESGTIKS